ncbi:MAG: tetratricopeptide repeat protein, partial [Planctomycetota bacterium]
SDRSDRGCVPERATALIWLLENERAQEYTQVIKSLVQSSDVNNPQTDIVRKVCVDLESTKNWGLYERFLDASFATARHPGNWAVLVGSCLSDKENQWAKRYFKYVSSRPGLVFRGESILAEEYMAEKKFKEAAAIYRDILSRCGPDDDRARFEFQLCKCLLDAGQYGEARSKLESFISNNRVTYRDLAKQAMLMKGQTHVQLGELDKALDSYFTLMVEYPDVENVPEIDFFIGYCYMPRRRPSIV